MKRGLNPSFLLGGYMLNKLNSILGSDLKSILNHNPYIPKSKLLLPDSNYITNAFGSSDRSSAVLKSLGLLFNSGRLAGTGYLSILPLDHGVEHIASRAFMSNVNYFDPNYSLELAIRAGCSGIVSTLGILGSVSRRYADKIPLIVKVNHNDSMSNSAHFQSIYSTVDQAFNLGASGIAATLYFGADDTKDNIERVSNLFKAAHDRGMFTILWAYLRSSRFVKENYHMAADLTGQANYLAATIEADIVKQKFPLFPSAFKELNYNFKPDIGNHPVDMVRFQVLNSFAGRVALVNSGGESGSSDTADLARLAIINKIAGGSGIMAGRKIFQKPMNESISLLNLIQDIYLSEDIAVR